MPISPSARPIIAVTMGDPGGIGPEVTAKSLADFKPCENFYTLLIGASVVFEFLKEEHGLALSLNPIPTLEREFLREDSINFLNISEKDGFDVGKISEANASMAFDSFRIAAYQAATGLVDAVVTAPVNKTCLRLVQPKFQGHTEYLAKVSRTKEFAMMFVSERLKVTLCTIHVPLKKVPQLITTELVLEKIRLTDEFLRQRLKISKPKIVVCALNPHGKETGEEDEIAIRPAVARAQQEKISAAGPLSADQLFHDAYEGRYDAVVAMYHDQGLAPFKMISFRDGVNVTLGLPFIRTSPDHGTAYDIAYKNMADATSMKAALQLAEKLVDVHPNRTP